MGLVNFRKIFIVFRISIFVSVYCAFASKCRFLRDIYPEIIRIKIQHTHETWGGEAGHHLDSERQACSHKREVIMLIHVLHHEGMQNLVSYLPQRLGTLIEIL